MNFLPIPDPCRPAGYVGVRVVAVGEEVAVGTLVACQANLKRVEATIQLSILLKSSYKLLKN